MAVAAVKGGPHASDDLVGDGNANFPLAFELFALLLAEQAVTHLGDLGRGEGVFVGEDDVTVDTEGSRNAGNDVEVAGAAVRGKLEEFIEVAAVHLRRIEAEVWRVDQVQAMW
jgi:hypothetical protein